MMKRLGRFAMGGADYRLPLSTYGASFSRTASGTAVGLNSPRFTATSTYLPVATMTSFVLAAAHFEVEVDRARADLSKVRVDDEQLVERDRMEEVALDVDARKPESEVVEERPVRQAARAEQLDLGQPEEAQVRLIVDDAGGVDVFPADVLGNGKAHGLRIRER